MSRKQLELPAKVRAVNAGNAYAKTIYGLLAVALRPWVGKQIEKVDGQLLKKVCEQLPAMENNHHTSVYRLHQNHSLAWVVKICEPLGNFGCLYNETVVYIGEMKNGVLTGICEPPTLRTDYRVEEITAKREAVEKAKALLSAAQSALYPFSEF